MHGLAWGTAPSGRAHWAALPNLAVKLPAYIYTAPLNPQTARRKWAVSLNMPSGAMAQLPLSRRRSGVICGLQHRGDS